MRKLLFLLILLPILVNAQVIDDFSDGDFANNPTWTGDANSFTINTSQQLQLNSAGEDTSILVTPIIMQSNMEWVFWVKLSFSPSGNNNARIYLLSSQADLKGSVNGYYVQCGESGSDDSIDLFRQDGNSSTKIIDGIDVHCSSSSTLRIRVVRENNGEWTLTSDITGGNSFLLEGAATDNTYSTGNYFGVFCKYTSSNANNFYFDDFYIGSIQVDTIPPTLLSYYLPANNTIELSFSEALNITQSEILANYSVTNGIGQPSSVIIDNQFPDKAILEFGATFLSGETYEITITNIADEVGNTMTDTTISFSWFQVSVNEIVINEIMADPSPVVGLPEQEYIELYNNSNFDIQLNNWILKVGDSEKSMPNINFPHNTYLLLCSNNAVSELEIYGLALGISSFPALLNSGQYIAIINDDGLIISEVTYSEDWYQDLEKEDGGWSLEKIDPNNNCSGISNWRASSDIRGGSPGIINSVFANNIDFQKPLIIFAFIDDSTHVKIDFSEEINMQSGLNTANYFINESQVSPTDIEQIDNNSLILNFAETFTNNSAFSLQIDSIVDFCDNMMNDTTIQLFYHLPQQWDIIINEIMADPSPVVNLPESDYIELFNTSDYSINVEGWTLQIDEKEKEFFAKDIIAGGYLIVCPEGNCPLFGQFVNCIDILGSNDLTNDGKTLAIVDKDKKIVSSVAYTPSWFNNSYKAEGGWSLERIDPQNFCETTTNWCASESSNGGTPGVENSVYSQNPDIYRPSPERVIYIDKNTIELIFSEQMDSVSLMNPENYFVEDLGNPVIVYPVMPLYQSVLLHFTDSFQHNHIYIIEVNNTWDCMGNNSESLHEVRFAVPEKTTAFDIVINEILFNPIDDGVDYIELYNRSEKCIDLQNLVFAVKDEYTGLISSTKEISTNGYLVFPEDYVVLTSSTEKVTEQYYTNNMQAFVTPDIKLPTMANDAGRVILMTKGKTVIDDFEYNEDMQFELLTSFDGVSLERINYNFATTGKNNWHSAAETIGFGTPGLQNSQYSEHSPTEAVLEVTPEVFSPDNDGFNDNLTISYKFEKAGYVGDLTVFNAKGIQIKKIANNELLAIEGFFTWDGLTDEDQKTNIGIYLIVLNYFDLEGNKNRVMKTCVLAGKLD